MAKITFKRDPKTGALMIFRNGKPHGEMVTVGDEIKAPEKKKKPEGKHDGKR